MAKAVAQSGAIRIAALTGVLALVPRGAQAYDARVDASLDAQFYSLRSPFGEPYLYRRRYTSTLGLDLEHLEGAAQRRGPTLDFRSRMRIDADFGRDDAERDPNSNRYVPGLVQAPLDVMYAYLEGRGFFRGFLDFRFGRQYVVDALGYWSFDGGWARLNLVDGLAVSGFFGFEQRLGLPMLSGGRFTAEGVWRGDRDGLEANQYPAFLDDSALAPAFGAAVESRISGFYSKLSYRKVQTRSTVLVTPFFDPATPPRTFSGTRTSSERLGYSAALFLSGADKSARGVAAAFKPGGSATARAVYDLFNRAVSDANLALSWYASSAVTLAGDVTYYYPTFDGDSIFNWFTHHPMTSAEGRVAYAPRGEFDFAVSSGARWVQNDAPVVNAADASASRVVRSTDLIGRASGRYRFGVGSVALDGMLETGDQSHVAGVDLTTRRSFQGGRYDALILASLYDWADRLRADRSATSFTYVLGAGMRPGTELLSRSRLGFEWEHSMNRLVGQRFRLLLTIDFTVLR